MAAARYHKLNYPFVRSDDKVCYLIGYTNPVIMNALDDLSRQEKPKACQSLIEASETPFAMTSVISFRVAFIFGTMMELI